MARLVHPVLVKASITGTEPLGFKGGWAAPIPKKGLPQLLKSYRSILCTNTISKCYHAFLRQAALDGVEKYLKETQCGARAGKGTDYVVH
eukprot:5345907-Pyramimonas_sp.AAC.1